MSGSGLRTPHPGNNVAPYCPNVTCSGHMLSHARIRQAATNLGMAGGAVLILLCLILSCCGVQCVVVSLRSVAHSRTRQHSTCSFNTQSNLRRTRLVMIPVMRVHHFYQKLVDVLIWSAESRRRYSRSSVPHGASRVLLSSTSAYYRRARCCEATTAPKWAQSHFKCDRAHAACTGARVCEQGNHGQVFRTRGT